MNNAQIIKFLMTRPAEEINYGYFFIPQEIADRAAENNEHVSLNNMLRQVTEVSFNNVDFSISRISRSVEDEDNEIQSSPDFLQVENALDNNEYRLDDNRSSTNDSIEGIVAEGDELDRLIMEDERIRRGYSSDADTYISTDSGYDSIPYTELGETEF